MPKEPEQFNVPFVRFIREQDGVPERQFKTKLCECFTKNGFKCRAYLVQVEYEVPNEFNIALCIRSLSSVPASLTADIGCIFFKMFRTDDHLDTIYLSAEREEELQPIASPFFWAGVA